MSSSSWPYAVRWSVVWLLLFMMTACAGKPVLPLQTALPITPDMVNKKPYLRLETGMHTAQIKRIAVDAAERYLVTAADDKTARVWDMASGELLQILRPPIGDGDEGKLYAVAISPDGKEVAVAGFTVSQRLHDHIYFFDRATARLTRSIAQLPNVINHLTYSADGRYLAAALWGANGIRIYDTTTLAEVGHDSNYGDDSYGLDFDKTGRLVSSSDDGFIRLYDQQFQLLKKVTAPGGHQPYAVAFSPEGGKIAVGFDDTTTVNVLSAEDLQLLYAPDTRAIATGFLETVAWSQDGQILYAGGSAGGFSLFFWTQSGLDQQQSWPLASSTIMDLIPLRDQRLAYGTADPAWGVIGSRGQKLLAKSAAIQDFRSSSVRLNSSASVVGLEDVFKSTRQLFDVYQQTYLDDRQNTLQLTAAITETPGLNITDWNITLSPKLNGQTLSLGSHERSLALAFSQDAQHFLLGADWSLRYYNRQGQEQWHKDVPSMAWAVNLSQDGRYAVAAIGDGTLRWYRTSDGQEQLAFFPHPDGKRWVLWTPEGFYSASADAEELIGYHLNQGETKEGQFVSVKQLGKLFYRPDLIAQRLQGNDAGIRAALAEIGDVEKVLNQRGLPPRLEPLSEHIDGSNLIVKFRVIEQGGGIGKLSYRINEVEQAATRQVHAGINGLEPVELTIPLLQGRNVVTVMVGNRDDSISSKPLAFDKTVADVGLNKPSLYVLAVGVSDYQDRSFTLQFADKDASALAAALEKGGERLFADKRIISLPNSEATLDNIKQSFAKLAKQIRPEDVFILYLAGHGKVFDGSYYFIPANAMYTSEKAFRGASLDENMLREELASIKAQKSVVLLDTCYAGKVGQDANLKNLIVASRGGDSLDEKSAISRLNRATGRAILAGTSDVKLALEGYNGHGYFTYALLEGLAGAADADHDHFVSVLELSSFLSKRVPKLTNNYQIPVLEIENFIDFPLGATSQ